MSGQALWFFLPLACASFGLARLVSAAQAYARLEARATTPLAKLREGPVEVVGRLHAVEPLDAISHVPCAALKVRAAIVEARGSRKTYHVPKTFVMLADATIEDRKGNRIRIPETHHVSIQAPAYLGGVIPLTEITPAWITRFGAAEQASATHLAVEEFRIEEGAWVTMHGIAERVARGDAGYRDGGGFRLMPPPGEPILLFYGKEADARRTAQLTCIAMAIALLVLLDLALQILRFG